MFSEVSAVAVGEVVCVVAVVNMLLHVATQMLCWKLSHHILSNLCSCLSSSHSCVCVRLFSLSVFFPFPFPCLFNVFVFCFHFHLCLCVCVLILPNCLLHRFYGMF